jgi:hypothetical protein
MRETGFPTAPSQLDEDITLSDAMVASKGVMSS